MSGPSKRISNSFFTKAQFEKFTSDLKGIEPKLKEKHLVSTASKKFHLKNPHVDYIFADSQDYPWIVNALNYNDSYLKPDLFFTHKYFVTPVMNDKNENMFNFNEVTPIANVACPRFYHHVIVIDAKIENSNASYGELAKHVARLISWIETSQNYVFRCVLVDAFLSMLKASTCMF